MYRRGTDLGEVLSNTLYLMKESSMRLLNVEYSESNVDTELFSFCNSINKRIHQQIKTTTKQDIQKTYDISRFDLESCIESIDPVLWNLIVLLTRSVQENRKPALPENITRQRKMQCLYTLCVILFNTNRSCSVPLHLLLTNLVESQGGSSELIHFLNSVGAIASADTLQRHVQFYIEKIRKQGILSELDLEKFTIVSIDNIDFLQRHASVYCGDQSRSWHGTTVQAVQPTYSTMFDTDNETSVVLQRKWTTHPTPENSPSTRSPALKKAHRRARTTKEAATHYLKPASASPR